MKDFSPKTAPVPIKLDRLLLSVLLAVALVFFLYKMELVEGHSLSEFNANCRVVNNPGLWQKPLPAFNRSKNDPENGTWEKLGSDEFGADQIVFAAYQSARGRRIDVYLKNGTYYFPEPIRLNAAFERLTQVSQHLPGGLADCCFAKIRRRMTRGIQPARSHDIKGSTFLLHIGQITAIEVISQEDTEIKLAGRSGSIPVGTRTAREKLIPQIIEYWDCKGESWRIDRIIK